MRPGVVRGFYLVAGMLALLLGVIGVVLPLLPTTPFVILAAFCFSRSSERLHQWLLNQRLFGPLIRDWEAHGVIPLRIKCLSTTMMLVLISYPMLFRDFDWRLKALAGLSILCALLYIWSRPSVPAPGASRQSA
ncbi:YbaN family protein [Marinobacterium sedimentorum]|uniref:YbaN family protein n=1 Tax=Marinobacterium sedimentorum TaxID=2927804 RepID=UPI0020C63F10|nr:YbaN family protein [Marinobacterium sedimentorum]MCP8688650.1 YbaN family protein [Marinobacterium sedimentorum]